MWQKLNQFFKEQRAVTFSFAILALLLCIATYYIFYDVNLFMRHPRRLTLILYADIVVALIAFFIMGREVVDLWRVKFKNGSKLTLKLVFVFSLISLVPPIVMSIFSTTFFHNGLESWFNFRNQTVLQDSLKVANSYLLNTKENTLNDCIAISRVIESYFNRRGNQFIFENEGPDRNLCLLLDDMCTLKEIDSAIIIVSSSVIAHSKYSVRLHFVNIKDYDLQNLQKLSSLNKNGMILESDVDNFNKLLLASCFQIPGIDEYIYILFEKSIDKSIIENASKASAAYNEYTRLSQKRSSLETSFVLLFFIVGLLIFFVSLMFAIFYSLKLLTPISDLINVSEDVIKGDFKARVKESKSFAEMQMLTKTFNQMLERIHSQQKDLKEINSELNAKIKFNESVLAGVSSGVIGLEQTSVYIWNNQAEALLGRDLRFGEHIENIFQAVPEMISRISAEAPIASREIQYTKGKEILLFAVKIMEISDVGYNRYIITFDDITDTVISQRKAAWSEVARRVAHEIKNPLTPIQLSAERIRRKYLSQISVDSEIFLKLIDVIVRQVGDIKRLIDEFNFFARLPDPKMKKCRLDEICTQAVFLMTGTSEVSIFTNKESDNYDISGDEQLLRQCVVNLIKNAINALQTLHQENKTVWVSLKKENGMIRINVEDNGPGLPQDKIDSLTVPYFTLMPKGTGLGLSIVKKIVQDHGGELEFGKSEHGGAKVSLIIPQYDGDKNEGQQNINSR